MGRRKKVVEEKELLALKLKDLEQELQDIEDKRLRDFEDIKTYIETNYPDYFYGVVVDFNTGLSLLQMAHESGKNIQIPMNIYYKES